MAGCCWFIERSPGLLANSFSSHCKARIIETFRIFFRRAIHTSIQQFLVKKQALYYTRYEQNKYQYVQAPGKHNGKVPLLSPSS